MNPQQEDLPLSSLSNGTVFVIDNKGQIKDLSPAAAAYFHLDSTALGKELLDVVIPHWDRQRVVKEFGYMLSLCTGGDARCQNLRFHLAQGEATVPATLRLMRERREDAEERFLALIQPDEMTSGPNVLRPLQTLLETVISNARDGIVIHDWNGTILYANDGAVSCLGFSSLPELLSVPAPQLWSRWNITGDSGPVDLTELPTWLSGQGGLSLETTLHFQHRQVPEVEKWLTVCTTIAEEGDSLPGTPAQGGAAVFLIHDLTARRRSDVDLLTSLQKQERAAAEIAGVLGQIADGVLIADAGGTLTFANAAARRLFGREPEETFDWNLHAGRVFGANGEEMTPDELPMALALLNGEVTENAEWRVVRPDGVQLWVQGSASPLRDANGNQIGAVMSLRDITSRRLMVEDLERANRIKDDFLTIISHELRTPLTPLVGYVSLLRNQVKSGKVVDPNLLGQALDGLENNVQQQRRIVEELLDASRVLLGSARFQMTLYPLTALVREVLAQQEDEIAAQEIAVHLALDSAVPAIAMDVSRLGQALGHIFKNAWVFSSVGGAVWISVKQEGPWAVLEVRDEGVGIPEEFLPHIFDLFRQGDEPFTRRHGGLGLGLAVVRAIVDAHEGQIQITSPGVGLGATLRIQLKI